MAAVGKAAGNVRRDNARVQGLLGVETLPHGMWKATEVYSMDVFKGSGD